MAKQTTDPRVDTLVELVGQLLTHASFPTLSGEQADALRARAAELTAPVAE